MKRLQLEALPCDVHNCETEVRLLYAHLRIRLGRGIALWIPTSILVEEQMQVP